MTLYHKRSLIPIFLIVFLILTPLFIEPAHAVSLFGYDTIGATLLGGSTTIWACKFTSPADMGTLTSISVYLRSTSGSNNFMAGIYSDNSGAPNAKVGSESSSTSCTGVDGWYTASVSIALSGNTVYWITIQTDNSNPNRNCDTGSANQFGYGSNVYGSFPSTFPSTTYLARKMSVYGNYTASGGEGQNLTFQLNETAHCFSTISFGHENSFQLTNTAQAWDGFISNKALSFQLPELAHAFDSAAATFEIYGPKALTFLLGDLARAFDTGQMNKALSFTYGEVGYAYDSATMNIALKITLFELGEVAHANGNLIFTSEIAAGALTLEGVMGIAAIAFIFALGALGMAVLLSGRHNKT